MRVKITQSEIAILNNGIITTFDTYGRFKQTGIPLSPMYLNGCMPMVAISTLTSNNYTEVATFDVNDNMLIYPPKDGKGTNTANTIKSMGGYTRMCVRIDEVDGVKYTQMIFLYNADARIDAIAKLF